MESQFELVMDNANLVAMSKAAVKLLGTNACNVPGVYFWLMRIGEDRYKLYIGKAKSLDRRVGDYMKEFQPQSVNDFKIRVFQEAVLEREPTAEFPLYFMEALEHTAKETEMIRQYKKPLLLLNRRAEPGDDAKQEFRKAFIRYYRAGFDHLLDTR